MAGRTFPPAEERFWAAIVFVPGPLETECALWQNYIDAAGYGQFERATPHRWAYQYYVGPVPKGKELDHLCRNRACANVLHLEPVTHRVNMERGAPANYTHCRRGHEFTEANTHRYRTKYGEARQCRACNAFNQRRWQGQRKQQLSNTHTDTHLGIDGP